MPSGQAGAVGAVGAALAQLRQAAATNIRASEADVTRGEVVVRGMTPHAGSGRLIIGGEMPDGRKVNLLVVLFSRGSWVFQATVLGEVLPPEGVETFLGGLQVVP